MATRLPDIVPTHWNASGHVDGYGSKWMNLLLMPGVMLWVAVLTVGLPKLSPEKFQIEPFEGTFGTCMGLISALMLAMHFLIISISAGARLDMSQAMMGVLFLFFIFFGNYMGRIQPNFYMGIRTPWTLSDERVWKVVHRGAGRLWVFGSIAGVVMVLIGLPFWLNFGYFMVLIFVPVVQSFFVYRSLHRPT
jgi:uncharacterized membrane protein